MSLTSFIFINYKGTVAHESSDFSELKLDIYIDIRFIILLNLFDAKEIIGHYSGYL